MSEKGAGVYIIQCEGPKVPVHYVGETSDESRRMGEHFSGRGSEFTKANPPIRRVHWIPEEDHAIRLYLERHLSESLIAVLGPDHVQGSYLCAKDPTKLKISKKARQLLPLKHEIPDTTEQLPPLKSSPRTCYKCGEQLYLFRVRHIRDMDSDELSQVIAQIHFQGGFVHNTWVVAKKGHNWVNYCPSCTATNMTDL